MDGSAVCPALDELLDWLQEREAYYAERALRLAKLPGSEQKSRDAQVASRVFGRAVNQGLDLLQKYYSPKEEEQPRRNFWRWFLGLD